MEKGRSIIELMDNGEIKVVVSEIRKITPVSQDMQKNVWAEFKSLGYEDAMKPVETLTIIRCLFNGSKINWAASLDGKAIIDPGYSIESSK